MPDIPVTDTGPAGNLVALGQGLMEVGGALGNVAARYDNQQRVLQAQAAKAYQDAEVARETMLARNYIDDNYNAFLTDLQGNPDHGKFVDMYEEKSNDIYAGAQQFIKLPEVQTNVDNYLAVKKGQVGAETVKLARDRLASEAEQLGQQTLNDAVSSGNTQKVADIRDLLLSRGIITAAQATSITEKDIPQAKYNNIFAQLLSKDQATRMAILSAADATKRTGLSQDQVDNMADSFTKRQAQIDAAAKREQDIANGKLELAASDKLLQYMTGGLRAAGFANSDQLYSYVSGLNWQGTEAGKLQKYWAEAFDTAVKGTATKVDPVKWAAGWDIVENPKLSFTEKTTALRNAGILNNGVPGDKYQELVNAAKSLETNPDWSDYTRPLVDWYGNTLAAMATRIDQKDAMNQVAEEKAIALSTMDQLFRKYPDNPGGIWKTRRDELMNSAIVKTVADRVQVKLGQWFAPGTPDVVVMNAALEQFPDLIDNPIFMAKYATTALLSGNLEKEEKKVLSAAGIIAIATQQAPNGDLNYQTANGTIYRVVAKVGPDKRIHNTVERYVGTPPNGVWK